jgi:hypothetical protein
MRNLHCLQEWRSGAALPELHLPAKNPFIPSDFGLLESGEEQPALLRDGGMVRLWHKPDPQFKVPKAVLYAHLQLPGEQCFSLCFLWAAGEFGNSGSWKLQSRRPTRCWRVHAASRWVVC